MFRNQKLWEQSFCYCFLFFMFVFCFWGCETERRFASLGIRESHRAYIPSRIAVLSCRLWPAHARFPGQSPMAVTTGDRERLCEAFDKHVLDSFSDQPYMKGYTPKLVYSLLKKAKKTSHLEELVQHWTYDPASCAECKFAEQVYQHSMEESTGWRLWLNRLSLGTHHADAVLLPLVVDVYERTYEDRGVRVAERSLEVALFLVDTNSGKLFWSGRKKSSVSRQDSLAPLKEGKEYGYPSWDILHRRLFSDVLWQEFPGRLPTR